MLVGDSLKEGLGTAKNPHQLNKSEAYIDHLLNLVEIPVTAKERYPHEFSGGERQRICLARALAMQPQLLILDEPTSALDVSIQKQVLDLLNKLQKELGLTYLLITHDWGVVAYLAHRVGVMQRGRLVELGATADLLFAPQNEYTQKLLASVADEKYSF
jgi:peptide/nickel transport system ATP-binding protein